MGGACSVNGGEERRI